MSSTSLIVVKVGGSLYDWPELGPRLRQFLASLSSHVVLVPGGGPFADVIRQVDHIHALGEEASHWLALNSLILAGRFIAGLVPEAKLIDVLDAARSPGGISVLDMARFARHDDGRSDHLPHSWSATSDSLAARVARVAGAERLILLKSTDPPADWTSPTRGYVDPLFAVAVAGATFGVEAINFRKWCTR